MADKIFEQKIEEVSGVKYTFQQPPATWYMDHSDNSKDDNGNLKTALYIKGLFETVVVVPRISIDDFTGRIRTMRKLVKAVEEFILGPEEYAEQNDKSPNGVKPKLRKSTEEN